MIKTENESSLARHPQKWRETCDPFALNYHTFHPTQILGYPHAGNDVFHAIGYWEGRETTAYIKAARQKGAAIENEVNILQQLELSNVPKVLDSDFGESSFCVTSELPGLRLSAIVGENHDLSSRSYMEEYGSALAMLHSLIISAPPVADRKFFHLPSAETMEKLGVSFMKDYFSEAPSDPVTVFCHGDFHYANILWKDHHISGILDFELSGYGNRDFDIAWALFLRPGQKFLKTKEEQQHFLAGYRKHGTYNAHAVEYYMAQIYVHFLRFCIDDAAYCDYVRSWLLERVSSK